MLTSFVTRLILTSVFPQSLGHAAVFVFQYFRLWHDYKTCVESSWVWSLCRLLLVTHRQQLSGLCPTARYRTVRWVIRPADLWELTFLRLVSVRKSVWHWHSTAQTWSSAIMLTSSLSFFLLRWSSVSLSTFCVWTRDWRTPWISQRVCPPARTQELVTTTSLLETCPASRVK